MGTQLLPRCLTPSRLPIGQAVVSWAAGKPAIAGSVGSDESEVPVFALVMFGADRERDPLPVVRPVRVVMPPLWIGTQLARLLARRSPDLQARRLLMQRHVGDPLAVGRPPRPARAAGRVEGARLAAGE